MSTNRIKVLWVSLLAVFAIGAVASTAASAHEYQYFPAPAKVTGTSGISKLEGEVAGVKTIIECKKDTFTGELEEKGKSKGEITFSECSLFEDTSHVKTALTKCTVPNIVFKFTDKLVRGQGLGPTEWGPEDEFNSTLAEEVFVEIKITGSECALKGTYKAKQHEVGVKEGTEEVKYKGQVCALPEAGVEEVEHEIVCTSSGSHLMFNGKPAYFFSTDKVKLESGAKWAAE